MKLKHIYLFILFLFISSNSAYSQYNWQKIYNADTCGIISFKHFKVNYDTRKIIYFQFGIPNQPTNSNEALYYSWCKLDNNSSSWIQRPHNSFLYSSPFYCPWPNVMLWRYFNVDNFMLSSSDPNLILETRDVPPCGPNIQEPIQDTRITYNGGVSYNTYSDFGNGFIGNQCGGFDIDPVNDSTMYMCYAFNTSKNVYKTINRGNNWSIIDTVQAVNSYGTLKVNPLRRNDIFIRVSNYMLKSTNGGTSFYNVGGNSFKELIFDRIDSSIYGYSQNQIYKSTNNGNNWNIISSILSAPVRCMEIKPDNHNILYAGNDSGLYISTNSGINWTLYNNSFYPSRRVIGLSKNINTSDTLYAVTSDAVYRVWGSFITVGINTISSETPYTFSLSQNYPNPFNPNTKIKFDIPGSSVAQTFLSVYDILGQEITTLVNEQLKPGTYSVEWNASNYPSGIYFYKLIVGDNTNGVFAETKKMVLIK